MRLKTLYLIFAAIVIASCSMPGIGLKIEGTPDIYPDYRDVTIPVNIAPLNFNVIGAGDCALKVSSADGEQVFRGKDGLISFSFRAWRRMISASAGKSMSWTVIVKKDGQWQSYEPFEVHVAEEKIDPIISYRLIPPGYQGWKEMGIYQRNLENFKQTPIFENKLSGENCLNCHTYCQRDPGKMVFHARADFGGTMMINAGEIEKLNTKTDSTISALVYPYWHPSGKYIAFSTNLTKQSFFNHDPNRIEVFDSASDVVVYDVAEHKISWSPVTKSAEMFETFPTFSPDGEWLYFCSAAAVDNMPYAYDQAKYGLYRTSFHEVDGRPGEDLECVYDAASEDRSVSFPRISPDGRWLAYTLHSYGNFSIWHKDADIWMMDLGTGERFPLDGINSQDVESWHCWSGNSRWLIVSSRRDDGLYTRPYIAYIDKNGRASKAFMLPQRDPAEFYKRLMFSYNLPEFMSAGVTFPRHRIADEMRNSKGIQVTF